VATLQGARSHKDKAPKRPQQPHTQPPDRPLQEDARPGAVFPHFYVLLPRQIRRAGQTLPGGVCLAGKLGHRGVVAAVRPGRLFFVTDSTSQRRYLVDTGSAFSIMPWQSSAPPSGPSLASADGRRIPCWGEQLFTVTIGGVPRQWRFLLMAVSLPILGVDFLRHHSLVVDVANLRLSPPPPPVIAITPGRPYADAVRSSPGAPLPARAPSSPLAAPLRLHPLPLPPPPPVVG
jgi:hypothetical protein